VLELGVPADAPYLRGDGYHGIPAGSRAIHVASWFLLPEAIATLIAHGADVNAPRPGDGATPLALVARGCTASYWTDRRSVEPARLLLDAGADPRRVTRPTGYDDLDALLASR
jgi:ankyrin repeat protein